MLTPLHLTPAAAEELKRLNVLLKIPAAYIVRISVKKNTDTGELPFIIGFDLPDKNDLTLEILGLTVHYHKVHSMSLAGTTIDFDIHEKGFIFRQ